MVCSLSGSGRREEGEQRTEEGQTDEKEEEKRWKKQQDFSCNLIICLGELEKSVSLLWPTATANALIFSSLKQKK